MGEQVSRLSIPTVYLTAAGFAFITLVFVLGIYFALTYERPVISSFGPESLTAIVSEALYLLGKLAFLSLALAAGVQLLRITLSGGEK